MSTYEYTKKSHSYPKQLLRMHRPPAQLYVAGDSLASLLQKPRVAIVGSRNVSPYGKQVTQQLARQLAEQGIVVVSGLAYGVDTWAHAATVKAGGQAIAVLPTPLTAIYPAHNQELARQIIQGGGALVSSYAPGSEAHKGNFVARNEIVAALSNAVVITEAAQKSGSLHTAHFAQDLGVEVLAVPGNITSDVSAGTNQLIRTGCPPVLSVADILCAIGISPQVASPKQRGDSPEQQTILDLLAGGVQDGYKLQHRSQLAPSNFNQALTMLEMTGAIRALGGNQWGLT